MKKTFALLFALVLCLGVVSPVLAYTGVGGQVVDSDTLSPWVWGGDVIVIDRTTNLPLALCFLDPAGNIIGSPPSDPTPATCDYGDPLFGIAIPIPPPAAGDNIEIQIDFHCLLSGMCSGGPAGTPSPLSYFYVADPTQPIPYIIPPPVTTGTGPNAVQLSGMSGSSGLAIAIILAMVAGGSLILKKKSEKESQVTYQAPEVVHDGVLEVQAGTTGDDLMDGLLGDWE